MDKPNFIDHVRMYCRSGHGGAGSSHFRREKYVPKGGPDGGDGGRGGHIIVRGSRHKWTLLHLRYHKHLHAERGKDGAGQRASGARGKDYILEVPLGSVVKNDLNGQVICEVTSHGEEYIILRGGQGGLGNSHFKSSTRQSPEYAQPGGEAEEFPVVIELKVLADAGLVGFPNSGKSTLLSVISAAKPKIADYPFTTLTPNLGMVFYRNERSFVVADIPGIIEKAHEGKGLGTRFLRHIERNAVLVFTIPADTQRDFGEEYRILLNELKQYNPQLLDKDRLLVITKSDLLDRELMDEIKQKLPDISSVFISAVTHQNLMELKDLIWQKLNK